MDSRVNATQKSRLSVDVREQKEICGVTSCRTLAVLFLEVLQILVLAGIVCP